MEHRTYLYDQNTRLTSELLSGDKQRASLVFYLDELLYDIRNIAFIEGNARELRGGGDQHLTYDIAEGGNLDRVRRVLDLAFSQVQDALYPYTRSPLSEGTSEQHHRDDVLEADREEYTLCLVVPAMLSRHALCHLERWIHEWLVCRVLADWMSLIGEPSYQLWLEKAELARGEALRVIRKRAGKIRRKMSPFV